MQFFNTQLKALKKGLVEVAYKFEYFMDHKPKTFYFCACVFYLVMWSVILSVDEQARHNLIKITTATLDDLLKKLGYH